MKGKFIKKYDKEVKLQFIEEENINSSEKEKKTKKGSFIHTYFQELSEAQPRSVSLFLNLCLLLLTLNLMIYILNSLILAHKIETRCTSESIALSSCVYFLSQQQKYCVCHFPVKAVSLT